MPAPSRSALLSKAHKVLRKHYPKLEAPDGSRPLLEELLYACCLENSSYAAADKTYQAVKKAFFDWNEVRVTSVAELSELMRDLHDARNSAMHLKRVLQSVFEATYSFDIESYKKKPIGQAAKELGKLQGVTPFAIDHVTQLSLGGHAVPIDRGVLDVLLIVGVVTPKEAASGKVPGLERNIAKNKGKEFAALLHQFGADVLARPFAQETRELLLAIAPDCKDRLPKRPAKKHEEPPAATDKGGQKTSKPAEMKGAKPTDGKSRIPLAEKPKAEAPKSVDAAAAEKDAAKKRPAAHVEPPTRAAKKESPPIKKQHASAGAKPRPDSSRSAKRLAKSKPR